MAEETRTGVLHWHEEEQELKVALDRDTNGRQRRLRPAHDLGPALSGRGLSELHGLAVELTWSGGKMRDVRPAGSAASVRPRRVSAGEFVNPYTFLPATPRTAPPQGLEDGPPSAHDRLHDDRITGQVPVRLTVVTPLLLLDPARAEHVNPADDNSHTTHPVLSRNGRPHLPATAVKGMLRAAYEAVTNSRMGVFTGHDDRLAMRMPATESQHMVPARISDDGRHVILLAGDTPPGGQTKPRPLLHAAWLPRYPDHAAVTYPDKNLPKHGHEVEAWVERLRHHRWDQRSQQRQHDFDFWRVRTIAPTGHPLPDPPDRTPESPRPVNGRSWHEATGERKRVTGWICVTNRNNSNKHDERLFFTSQLDPPTPALTQPLVEQWEETIRGYRAAHRNQEIHGRKNKNGETATPYAYLGGEPGRTAWSPHQYENDLLTLGPGALCYARMAPGGRTVQGLYPVMISRRLFGRSPLDLLERSLRPATSPDELSPADRVFGWVRADGRGAERGRLRIGPVDTAGFTATEFGTEGVPLAVLGGPKPQQARFYLGTAPDGTTPLADPTSTGNRYTDGQRLRGRKAYWHHRDLPEGYWENPAQDRTQQPDRTGRFQEYRRPDTADGPQRDTQNRSVQGWITPGSTCTFTITVTDLTDIELGALAWLLTLPERHYHRLGFAKPLGFGSIRLDIDPEATADLRTGHQWRTTYRTLDPDADRPTDDPHAVLDRARQAFEAALTTANGRPAAETPHLAAFLAVSSGPSDAAVHYPRTRDEDTDPATPVPPDPDGNNYTWFAANEKIVKRGIQADRGLSLPTWDNPNLPLHPHKKRRRPGP
ncbi:TIGR03986 family CRISPR-associated RAMP protein [Streptomyces canus]|uniref:TIGR03986 family type III CRISPR-associated RAMP protein n=1 Tax=Streptomyces canus TaxID=58343 RepID=UPI003869F3C2|nr:TIGR03986 family CRISPR-associated RAMP protein [Streptomyces canus]